MNQFCLILFLCIYLCSNGQNKIDTIPDNNTIIIDNSQEKIWIPISNLNNCANDLLKILINNCNEDNHFSESDGYLFYTKIQKYGFSVFIKPIEKVKFYDSNLYGCFKLHNKIFYCYGNKPEDLFSKESSDSIVLIEKKIQTKDSLNDLHIGPFFDLNTKEIKKIIGYKKLQYNFIIQPCTNFSRREINEIEKSH